MSKPRILVVEDDPVTAMLLKNRLQWFGYEVSAVVDTGEEAIDQAAKDVPDLALMDIQLEGRMDGVEAACRLRTLFDVPVIYVTVHADEALLERAKEAEPLGYLVKPFGERELRSAIEVALYKGGMERKLKQSEERFRNLGQLAPFGISIMASDTSFEYLNPKFTEIFGYTIDDVPDMNTWFVKIYPDEKDRSHITGNWQKTRDLGRLGEVGPETSTVTCKDGGRKAIKSRTVVLADGRQIVTHQDVTAEIEAQEQIVRAKNQWELTFDAVSDGIMILDGGHRILQMNRAMADALGIGREEAVGRHCYEVVHGLKAPIESCAHSKVMAEGREHCVEVVEDRMGGGVFDVRVSPIRAHDGRVMGSVHTARDITERKNSEEELRRAHEFQNQLLATAATAIFTVDSERRVTGVNAEFSRITGFQEEEVLGKTCRQFALETCATKCGLDALECSEDLSSVQCNVRAKDGRTLTVLKNSTVMKDREGRTVGRIESFIDVTELMLARIAAEQASRAKTEFLTTMSHELRTPLNAIIGFSELLLDRSAGELNDEQSSYITDTLDSGRHLLDLINSILDLAKVEAGKIELELSRVSIAELIRHCLMMIREKTIRRSLSLELTIENGLKNLAIQADELKLKQILYNLLSNAAKFTPEGGAISIVASKQGNEILVSVSDTGVGIKPEDQGRIFEIFEQADPSYARRVRGTGLGLALTRSLVQLHGGRIWAESEGEGQGSTFHFVIPMVEANALVIVDESETPFERSSNRWGSRWQQALETQSQPTVLVVEDDEINLHFTTVLLQRAGCRVLQAANAEDSIRVAKSQKPDLILMDVQLPSMDGLTATRILKQSPETASIPVVVVTACAMPGDEQECLAAGCATYIPKPIDSKRLRTVLRELLRTEESG